MRPSSSLRITLALLLLVAGTGALFAQGLTTPPGGANQRAVVTQYLGMVSVTIDYNSPDVTSPTGDDRTGQIWGQLVPWGIAPNPFFPGFGTAETMPWRAGSNQNTTITFSHDIEIEGQPLAAGTYALFMSPGETEWTIIFNKNSSAWGSFFYEPSLDALKVQVQPEKTDFFREWLTYEFDDRQLDTAQAVLHWENLRVPFRISVPEMPELYHETMSMELTGAAGFNFQNWIQASQWAAQQDAYHEDAARWADAAITANTSFQTISNKAQVLNLIGRSEEAMEALDQAMEHPTATVVGIHMAARGMQAQGKLEDANVIFRKNYELNPGEWPVDFGMARVYAQEGDFEKAMEHAEISLGRAPEGPERQNLETQIERLKKGENINP
jgi:tetratricopeptide (TPR) repeat protein